MSNRPKLALAELGWTEREQARFEPHRAEGLQPGRVAVAYGAVERVRPKMMTVTAITAGLLPILWSHGAGADVMKRIAAPMVGGMVSSTILTLVVIPAIYSLWKERELRRGARVAQVAELHPGSAEPVDAGT